MEIITQYLLDNTVGTQIALLGLLPRGDPPGYKYSQPSMFSAAIGRVNQNLRWEVDEGNRSNGGCLGWNIP